jgi:hypothetical protein
MTFANPALLIAGLLCVGVPILIHILMRRRRQPVSWGAMEWLMQAYRQQRKRMRFEQLLLLALRCLLVALVGLALAKPLFGDRAGLDAQRAKTLAILLDNSLTSQATSADSGQALDAQKAAAVTLIDQLDPARGDRVGLILLASPAQPLVAPASSDLAEVKRLIMNAPASDARADLSAALEAVAAVARDEQTGTSTSNASSRELMVAVMSDLREGSLDLAAPWRASPAVSRVLVSGPATQPLANVSLTSLEPLSSLVLASESGSTSTVPLRLTLTRSGQSTEQRTTLKAWLVDATRLTTSLPVAPADAARAEVSWTAGQREASITLSAPLPTGADPRSAGDWIALAQIDQDAIAADNWIARPLEARAALTIALVGPAASADASSLDRFTPKDWLALALAPTQTSVLAASSIRTTRLEARDFVGASAGDQPGSTGAPSVPGVLRGVSGVVVTEPQLLDASGWRALRAAASNGVFVMIVPPEAEQAQTWTDSLRENLGVPWQFERATREVVADVATLAPGATASGDDDLLSVLRPEFEELTRATRVSRLLPIESGLAPSHTLLALRDGTPVIVAARASLSQRAATTSNAGWVVLWLTTPSLSWTDLPAKPLMVPLVQELVRQAVGRSANRRDAQAGLLASAASLPGAVELTLAQPFSRPTEEQPAIALSRATASTPSQTALRRAGLWRAKDAGGAFIAGGSLAINAAHAAGNTTPIPREQVESWITGQAGDAPRQVTFLSSQSATQSAQAQPAQQANLRADRSQTWAWSFWLLIAAAAVALVEAILARWFSHATIRTDQASVSSAVSAADKPSATVATPGVSA